MRDKLNRTLIVQCLDAIGVVDSEGRILRSLSVPYPFYSELVACHRELYRRVNNPIADPQSAQIKLDALVLSRFDQLVLGIEMLEERCYLVSIASGNSELHGLINLDHSVLRNWYC
jgi:hypothetical protein